MILQALNRYYQILLDNNTEGIAPPGFSKINAHVAVVLSEEGELLGLTSLLVEEYRGKKKIDVPIRLIVPEQVLRSGTKVLPNFLWDNTTYTLGVSEKDEKDSDYSNKRNQAFKEFNLNLLTSVENKSSRAMVNFLNLYSPDEFKKSSIFSENAGLLEKANVVFKLLGAEGFIHDDVMIKTAWKNYLKSQSTAPLGQCLVTGEISEIELTHSKIKGISGGQPAGTVIVGFNERAYESFNKTGQQGLNAPVSKEAMFNYTTALNFLVQSQRNKMTLDDTTVVYWAESSNPAYVNMFSAILNPASATTHVIDQQRDIKAEQEVQRLFSALRTGQQIDFKNFLTNLDPNTRFHVLGLSPNAARLSVRFYYSDPFFQAIQNLVAHHKDLEIVNEYKDETAHFTIWRIIKEIISKKSRRGGASPLLEGAVLRSVIMNLPYPSALYNAILIRIRADQDDKTEGIRKINHLRASIIKAYLLRKYRNSNKYKEELQMSLNKDSTNQAYLLGRLFAVLEKAQQDAAGGELNATIKDRYFTSACATPATTFPVLLRLSQHHLSKSEYGRFTDRLIQEIMDKLKVEDAPFPRHLNLDEQGIFVLGYYHQKVDFFTKKAITEMKKDEEE